MNRPRQLAVDLTAGVHTSISKGLAASVNLATKRGCDCFQIFARNPRGWMAKPLDELELHRFLSARDKSGLWPLAIHAVYLINLAAADPIVLERSRVAFRQEIERALALRADYLVVHPGSGKGFGTEQAMATTVESVLDAVRGLKLKGASKAGRKDELTILIENTAGQGSSIGSSFEEVERIVSDLSDDLPVAVCLDTAHTFASGYDISKESGLRTTIKAINQTFGFDRIKLIHCNDSKVPLGSRVDRHQHIGLGHIGDEAFRRLTHSLKFRRIPFILETPIDKEHEDEWNLRKLRELSAG